MVYQDYLRSSKGVPLTATKWDKFTKFLDVYTPNFNN